MILLILSKNNSHYSNNLQENMNFIFYKRKIFKIFSQILQFIHSSNEFNSSQRQELIKSANKLSPAFIKINQAVLLSHYFNLKEDDEDEKYLLYLKHSLNMFIGLNILEYKNNKYILKANIFDTYFSKEEKQTRAFLYIANILSKAGY